MWFVIASVVVIVLTVLFATVDYGDSLGWVAPFWFVLGIWFLIICGTYISAKSELEIIDEKIQVITEMNEQRIKDIIPVLEKYPKIEQDIIGNINPNNFAVIGSVYPQLKSDKVYQAQAKLFSSNIKKLEDLKLSKLDQQKYLYQTQMQVWFLK